MPAGPVQQELPDAVSSAVAVITDTESPHWLVLTSTQTVVLPMAQPKSARSVAPKTIPQAPYSSQPHTAAQSQGQTKLMCYTSPLLRSHWQHISDARLSCQHTQHMHCVSLNPNASVNTTSAVQHWALLTAW